ncbi:uncharacterized protein LOC114267942 [Camellia sinensis]|uniref:uncharacterized protein LOC114267942 n=1 Tax=Camellia sinensis TaxID=4442 RepID=UPI001036034C|nr:uncharacterized protein LOC114267942 [Camellia sinensis]
MCPSEVPSNEYISIVLPELVPSSPLASPLAAFPPLVSSPHSLLVYSRRKARPPPVVSALATDPSASEDFDPVAHRYLTQAHHPPNKLGFSQEYDIDYKETCAPVAKMTIVRTLFSVAVVCSWPLYQMDVKNAFLNDHLTEEVYMRSSLGLHYSSGQVCCLWCALYGLKQIRLLLLSLDLILDPSVQDSTLFLLHTSAGFVALLLYVDDMIITGFDSSAISEIKQHLFRTFEMKDLGPLWYFLGIEVVFSPKGYFLSRVKYANEVIHCAGLTDTKISDTPIEFNVKLNTTNGVLLDDPTLYRELVSCLVYLTVTRPDLAYAVHVVSQFVFAPRSPHWAALVQILHYLRGIIFQDLLLFSTSSLDLVAYANSNWVGGVTHRKSISGFYIFLGDSLISWKSKKQTAVARSTVEAEYRAIAHATAEIVWLRCLLTNLDVPQSFLTSLYCDNRSAIQIAHDTVFHERTKHIEIDCHFFLFRKLTGVTIRPTESKGTEADVAKWDKENYELEISIRGVSQKDKSIQEFYYEMTTYWDQLALMEPSDLQLLDSYTKYREKQRLVQFLMALCDQFEPLRGAILHRSPVSSVDGAVRKPIVEETRFKVAHGSVFWGEAVLTAAYLLNRMPTPILSGSSPYERLFGVTPNYSLLRGMALFRKVIGAMILPPESYVSRMVQSSFGCPRLFSGYGIDYNETFAPVAKMITVHTLIFVAVAHHWPLFQLDVKNAVKNAFLNGHLAEEVYIRPLSGLSHPSGILGFRPSHHDCTLFVWRTSVGLVLLLLYVDGMIITVSDCSTIEEVKHQLFKEFEMKDLVSLRCFLGIEVATCPIGYLLSQTKYACDILSRANLTDDKIATFLRTLRYLRGTLLQCLLFSASSNLTLRAYVDADWAGDISDRKSTFGLCVFLEDSLISWKSKKQSVVARSTAEAEYCAMTHAISEIVWLRWLLFDMGLFF